MLLLRRLGLAACLACGDSHHQNKLGLESSDHVGVDFGCGSLPIRGEVMKQQLKLAGLAVLLSIASGQAVAQEKLKIGVIVTLSGPAAVLGQQVRDGFALAVKDLGGKRSGRDVEVVAVDDRRKPGRATPQAEGRLEREKRRFVRGPTISHKLP